MEDGSTAPSMHQNPKLAIRLGNGDVHEAFDPQAQEPVTGGIPERMHAQIAQRVGVVEYASGWTVDA